MPIGITTWFIWISYRLFIMYEIHSGYAIRWLNGMATEFHDFHHTHNNGCYGSLPAWDYLMCTCDAWQTKLTDNVPLRSRMFATYILLIYLFLT
jgi:sterol desaturase/sphingolipid hydroxylase (fatty acid hydroxylase superfamily)